MQLKTPPFVSLLQSLGQHFPSPAYLVYNILHEFAVVYLYISLIVISSGLRVLYHSHMKCKDSVPLLIAVVGKWMDINEKYNLYNVCVCPVFIVPRISSFSLLFPLFLFIGFDFIFLRRRCLAQSQSPPPHSPPISSMAVVLCKRPEYPNSLPEALSLSP